MNVGAPSRRTDAGWRTCRTNRDKWKSTSGRLGGDAASGAGSSAAAQWQVSTVGGVYPRWRPDGQELYYLGPPSEMMGTPITVTGATLTPGAPAALFHTRIYGGGADNLQGRQYDVTRDGRFLINTVLGDASGPITLLQNWKPEVKK
jgi:hypothetical protein